MCLFYINGEKKEDKEEIFQEFYLTDKQYSTILIKAQKKVDRLKKQLTLMSSSLSIDSFYELLEKYIINKGTFNDLEKRAYLQLLLNMSEIYEINLKKELQSFNKELRQQKEEHLFNECCLIIVNNEENNISKLKKEASKNKLDFSKIYHEASNYIDTLEADLINTGYSLSRYSFYEIFNNYRQSKSKMDNEQKEKYLRLLLKMSKIYNINLKKMFNPDFEENITYNLSSILDNNAILKDLIEYRYAYGNFDIIDLDNYENEHSSFDLIKEKSAFLKDILPIIIDLKSSYNFSFLQNSNDINEKEIEKITPKDIYKILNSLDELSTEKISEKLKISQDLILLLKELNQLFNLEKIKDFFDSEEKNIIICIKSSTIKHLYKISFEFIKSCLEKRIGFSISTDDSHNICYYSLSKDNLKIALSILDNIKLEYPNWQSKFINPPNNYCHVNNSYYGIALFEKYSNKYDYNTYFNYLCEISYYRVIAKLIINKCSMEDKKTINNIIELNKDILDQFNNIKDLINSYIPDVMNTLQIYLTKEINTFIDEFKKSLKYIRNILNEQNKKDDNNIIFNEIVFQDLMK